MGVVATGTQVVVLREALSAFLGNELVISTVLFSWLTLTGTGAWTARLWSRRISTRDIPLVVLGVVMLLPPLTLHALRLFPLLCAPPGSLLDVRVFIGGSVLILAPFCMLTGAFFPLLVRVATEAADVRAAASVYAWEALGSLLGGALFGVLLFDIMPSQDVLLYLSGTAGLCGVALALRARRWQAATVLGAGMVASAIAAHAMGGAYGGLALRYPGQTILEHTETPFGVLDVTRFGGQTSVFLNNVPLFVTDDVAGVEEEVHFAVVQRPVAPHVLIVGGNPVALSREVLKYDRSDVVCLEENSWLRRLEMKYLPFAPDSRVHLVQADPRAFMRTTDQRYDVVILVAPDPATIQTNRLFTAEALTSMHRILLRGGVLSLSLPSSEEYAGADARQLRAILLHTLQLSFAHVVLLPAGRDLFLASDGDVRTDIASAVHDAGIATAYVNRDYVQDDLLQERAQRMNALLQVPTPVNTDGHPVLMLAQIRYWLRFFALNAMLPVAAGIGLVAFVLLRCDRIAIGLMTAGSTGMILELIVIMIVQVAFGNVYKMIGGLVAISMAGMGAGAIAGGRMHITSHRYAALQGGGALAVLVAAHMLARMGESPVTGAIILGGCLVTGAFAAGAVFAFCARMRSGAQDPRVAVLYACDLLGGAFATLIVGPYLLPVFGVSSLAAGTATMVVIGTSISLTSPVWLRQRGYTLTGQL